jgi:ketosteroid isomerase-like protein
MATLKDRSSPGKEAATVSQESQGEIERFWQMMNTNDFAAVGRLLHDDFLLEWPQSGERIRGAENYVTMNERYPAAGPWRFTVNRVVGGEGSGASDVTVTDGKRVDRAVTFFVLRDGRIWRMTEYWPEPFPPADWRRPLVEALPTQA